MKLISFAIISLLAITASAQSPHGTATQDMDQSQMMPPRVQSNLRVLPPRGEQQSDQDKAQTELKDWCRSTKRCCYTSSSGKQDRGGATKNCEGYAHGRHD
ncbi:hypothetical protein BASA83_007084 [Batrachochytrium salamandrivorans]|nr:hypothetical protein BASA83_007084 [Batrachochytrium salamandrivorans]